MLDMIVGWFAIWGVWVVLVIDVVIRVTAIIVVPRNRRPTAAMAWLTKVEPSAV